MANGANIRVSPIGELQLDVLIKDLETILGLNLQPKRDPFDEEWIGTFIDNHSVFTNASYYLVDIFENFYDDPPYPSYEYVILIKKVWYKDKRMTFPQAAVKFGWELWNELLKTERYAMLFEEEFGPILATYGSPRPISPENSVIARERRLLCKYRGFDYLFLPLDSILWATPDLNGKWGGVTVQGSRYLPNDTHSGWVLWTGDEEPNEQTEFVQIVAKDVDEWRRIPTWLLGLAPGWRFIQDAKSHADKIWYDETLLSVPPSYRLL